jgi:hypothetical protein
MAIPTYLPVTATPPQRVRSVSKLAGLDSENHVPLANCPILDIKVPFLDVTADLKSLTFNQENFAAAIAAVGGTVPSGGSTGTNAAPVANNVTMTTAGAATVGAVFTLSYQYADAENNPESGTVRRVYHASPDGSGEALVATVTGNTYTANSADQGKILRLGVTPGAVSGTAMGTEAFSPYTAVIAIPTTATSTAPPTLSAMTLVVPTFSNAQGVNASTNTLVYPSAGVNNPGYGLASSNAYWPAGAEIIALFGLPTAGGGSIGIGPTAGGTNDGEAGGVYLSQNDVNGRISIRRMSTYYGSAAAIANGAQTLALLYRAPGSTSLLPYYSLDGGATWKNDDLGQFQDGIKLGPVPATTTGGTLWLKYFAAGNGTTANVRVGGGVVLT